MTPRETFEQMLDALESADWATAFQVARRLQAKPKPDHPLIAHLSLTWWNRQLDAVIGTCGMMVTRKKEEG